MLSANREKELKRRKNNENALSTRMSFNAAPVDRTLDSQFLLLDRFMLFAAAAAAAYHCVRLEMITQCKRIK